MTPEITGHQIICLLDCLRISIATCGNFIRFSCEILFECLVNMSFETAIGFSADEAEAWLDDALEIDLDLRTGRGQVQ